MNNKVLIIDDDEDFIESTKVVLESKGYIICSALNKKEGLKRIEKDSPDMIIMDVMMDKMCDGFDLTREIKNNDKYKDIPILMLTAVEQKTGFKFSEAAGDDAWLPVDDFSTKPIKPEDLIAKVEKLLSK